MNKKEETQINERSQGLKAVGFAGKFYADVVNALLAEGTDESALRRALAKPDGHFIQNLVWEVLKAGSGFEVQSEILTPCCAAFDHEREFRIADGTDLDIFSIPSLWIEGGRSEGPVSTAIYRHDLVFGEPKYFSLEERIIIDEWSPASPAALLTFAKLNRHIVARHSLCTWFFLSNDAVQRLHPVLITVSYVQQGTHMGKLALRSQRTYWDHSFPRGVEVLVTKPVRPRE